MFLHLQMKDNRIMVTLKLGISWSDRRLLFRHLLTDIQRELTENELSLIWMPMISIPQASFEDNYNILLNEGIFRQAFINLKQPSKNRVINGTRGKSHVVYLG